MEDGLRNSLVELFPNIFIIIFESNGVIFKKQNSELLVLQTEYKTYLEEDTRYVIDCSEFTLKFKI